MIQNKLIKRMKVIDIGMFALIKNWFTFLRAEKFDENEGNLSLN